jgi:hypothetical protein
MRKKLTGNFSISSSTGRQEERSRRMEEGSGDLGFSKSPVGEMKAARQVDLVTPPCFREIRLTGW